jgi:hypothetical protein
MQMVDGLPVIEVIAQLKQRLENVQGTSEACGLVHIDSNDSYENLVNNRLKLGGTFTGIVVFSPLDNQEGRIFYPECYDDQGNPITVPFLAAVDSVDNFFDTFIVAPTWDEISVKFAWDGAEEVFLPDQLIADKGRFERFSMNEKLEHIVQLDQPSWLDGYKDEDNRLPVQTGFKENVVTDIIEWITHNTKGRWNLFGSKSDEDTFTNLGVGFELASDMMLFRLSNNTAYSKVNSLLDFL